MAISDTSFFNNYQLNLGTVYARNYQILANPLSSYQSLINTRQTFLAAMSAAEVNNGITVVNSSLQTESNMYSANYNAISALNSSLNSFFQNQYSFLLRDYFTGLNTNNNIPWTNSFKDSWQKTTNSELVQQIGFATWNGSNFVFYPPYSSATNTYNVGVISSAIGNTVTFSSYSLDGDLSNFALPGYYVVAYNGSFPNVNTISLTTSVVSLLSFGTMAFSMNDVLLEPYGGELLNMSVSATTVLTATLALGCLFGFSIASKVLSAGYDPFKMASNGAKIGVPAFILVILAAPLDSTLIFILGVVMIGFGNGLFSHGTLTATMRYAPENQSGLALGAWGAVQATAAGIAVGVGGIFRDILAGMASRNYFGVDLNSPATGYCGVYLLEIILLLITIAAMTNFIWPAKPVESPA